MNMFYTGLGIARSLGERGTPVIGLSAHRGTYGEFTRYAKIRRSPDSRLDPLGLLDFLIRLRDEIPGDRAVIFPTRDDDLIFLDRFRAELQDRFILMLPSGAALEACLDKWQTHRWAQIAGAPSPRCWMIADRDELLNSAPDLTYPCVLKPVSAHRWRQARNWSLVRGRKAIGVSSFQELMAEYDAIAPAEPRVLIQEMVPGGDDRLRIAACYLDRDCRFAAGFTAEKVLQVPAGFGTGCIVKSAAHPELLETAARLLETMRFSGIAEVEFKWDEASGQHKLIEVNPRAWDQHRLGNAAGVDLTYLAYCDSLGLPRPSFERQRTGQTWLAEDVFSISLVKAVLKRGGQPGRLIRLARGQRLYAIWSLKDPLPFLAFLTQFVPQMFVSLFGYIRRSIGLPKGANKKAGSCYDNQLENAKCKN